MEVLAPDPLPTVADRKPLKPDPYLRPYLHLVTLWAFAVTQPILDLVGRNVVFLVAHRVSGAEIVVLVLAIALGVPTLLMVAELAVERVHGPARNLLHLVFVGLLLAAVALPVVNRIFTLPRVGLPVYLLAAGTLSAVAYARFGRFRLVLTVLSPAVALFASFFMFATPVSQLLLPGSPAEGSITASEDSAVPVVLVVLDELPLSSLLTQDGLIDAERLPNFARLANGSTLYRNATSVHPSTRVSIPSILTGTLSRERLPIAAAYPDNLFRMLGSTHRIDAWESVTNLCPGNRCGGEGTGDRASRRSRFLTVADDLRILYLHVVLPPSWRSALPPIDDQWSHFGAASGGSTGRSSTSQDDSVPEPDEDQLARADAFIEGIRSGIQPTFHYLHLALPHRPFRLMPSGRRYQAEPNPGSKPGQHRVWGTNEYLVTQMQQRHLLQVGHVDQVLGRILDTLEDEGLLDTSLLVVTADHGMSFEPGQAKRRLNRANASAILPVPLFVKVPGQTTGAVDDSNVELIDIAPTVADALDVAVPWDFDGSSLLDEADPPRTGKSPMLMQSTQRLELPGDLHDEVMELVNQRYERFGAAATVEELLAIGPHADLVGQPVRDLSMGPPSTLAATVQDAERFLDLRPEQDPWPNRVLAEVTFAEPQNSPVDVVVAVNGVVAGVGETYGHDGSTAQVSLMTSDHRFEPGDNLVRLYEVQRSTTGRTLHEIADR